MAADYAGIRDAIAAQIDANVSVPVVVEQVPMPERAPKVYVFLHSRTAPGTRQNLNGGRKTRFLCTYSVWVYAYGYKIANAISARNALLADVELALMDDVTFGRSDVFMSWQDGGEVDYARQDVGFNVGAEIRLIVDVTAEISVAALTGALLLEGDSSGSVLLEGDESGELLLEGSQ
jgi:hypothetical protein